MRIEANGREWDLCWVAHAYVTIRKRYQAILGMAYLMNMRKDRSTPQKLISVHSRPYS